MCVESDSNICPVTNQPCLKPGTFAISETIGNKTISTTCCRDCASQYCEQQNKRVANYLAQQNPNTPTVVSPQEFFSKILNFPSLFGEIHCDLMMPAYQQSKHECPKCHATMSEILQVGKVGCDYCYTHFKEELEPYVKKVQYKGVHTGKTPSCFSNSPSKNEKDHELDILEAALKEAIKEEQYEKAAYCRDRIAKLKGTS